MRYFFVDFENTGPNGLNGIHHLNKTDEMILMYSGNVKLSIDTVQNLHKLGNRLKYYRNQTVHANALDFQMVYWIGYLSRLADTINDSKVEIIIISNDKGYDAIKQTIAYLNLNVTIERNESIAEYFHDFNNDYNQPEEETPTVKPKYTSLNINPAIEYLTSAAKNITNQRRTSKILKKGLSIIKNLEKEDINTITKELIPLLNNAQKDKAMNLLTQYFTKKQANNFYIASLRVYRAVSKARK